MTKFANKGKITGTQIEHIVAINEWFKTTSHRRLITIEFNVKNICEHVVTILTNDGRVVTVAVYTYGTRARPTEFISA